MREAVLLPWYHLIGVFPIMHCVLWREEKHLQLLYDLILMLHTQMIYTRGRWRGDDITVR